VQTPEVSDPQERLSASGGDALVEALRRLSSPQVPRAVRTREVVVTLHGESSVIHEED